MTFLLHTILHYLRFCWNYLSSFFGASSHRHAGRGGGLQLSSLFGRPSGKTLTFDNGMQVEMGKQIAEGGFSYVFEAYPMNGARGDAGRRASVATVDTEDTSTSAGGVKYALKRINCADHEIVQTCRHEAGVHRSLPSHHPNLMELLGLKFDNDMSCTSPSNSTVSSTGSSSEHHEYNVCYMLFPYIPRSLRGEISQRNILLDDPRDGRRPFSTREVLKLFGGLVDALTAMHDANLSHRDVKLENVLLQSRGYGDDAAKAAGGSLTPVLMDFGSAGPLTAQLNSRPQVLTAIENAAQHTTMPYRPPELFEGGLRHGPREVLDYGKVDVWSLGCVLFGLMHGASPFEVEFVRGDPVRQQQPQQQYGLVRIVECTHLKILGEAPLPSWASDGANESTNSGKKDGKYPLALYELVRYMVHHDRAARPGIHEAARRFGEVHLELLGERWTPFGEGRREGGGGKENYDDFDSLIAGRDFV